MTAIESLTLRCREVRHDVKAPLRITAPTGLIFRMIDAFEQRGETPDFDDDFVRFGPHITVHADDDLPDNVFKIEILEGCNLDRISP